MMMCDAIEALGVGAAPGPCPSADRRSRRRRAATATRRSALFDILFEESSYGVRAARRRSTSPRTTLSRGLRRGVGRRCQAGDRRPRARGGSRARRSTAEHQRVQGADHYAVLMVGRRARRRRDRGRVDDPARSLLDQRHRDRHRSARSREARRAARARTTRRARRCSIDERKRSRLRPRAGGRRAGAGRRRRSTPS